MEPLHRFYPQAPPTHIAQLAKDQRLHQYLTNNFTAAVVRGIQADHQPVTEHERRLITHLNRNGYRTGIILPFKVFEAAPLSTILILPHYDATLLDLLPDLSTNDILTALHQIFSGLEYLQSENVYHGDISPNHILYRKSDNRYDIADFETGLNYSSFQSCKQFDEALAERPPIIDYFETLQLRDLPDQEAVSIYRSLLQRHDCACLGYLIQDIADQQPHMSSLIELKDHILKINSLYGVNERLNQLI